MDVQTVKRRLSGAWVTVWQRVAIGGASILDSRGSGAATAGYRLNTSGAAEQHLGPSYSTIESWLPFGTPGDYECRATLNSGTLSAGTTGSWLALSSSREWNCVQSIVGTNAATITVEIRVSATGVVLDSATIDLTAERT